MGKYSKISHHVDEEIINWLTSASTESYQCPHWLISNFSEPLWNVVLTKRPSLINWNVRLDDGSLLTAPKNKTLLEIFKYWLCIQGHPDFNGGSMLARNTIAKSVGKAARLIDYFLIRADHFQLGRYGLSLVTASDIKGLYSTLASSNETDDSIYEVEFRLRRYLRAKSAMLTDFQVQQCIAEQPLIAALSVPHYDRVLFPDDHDLIRVRSHLYREGHYGRTHHEFRQFSSFSDLLRNVYPDAIWPTRSIKFRPEELWLTPFECYFRERKGVPVACYSNEQMSWKTLTYWDQVIRSLGSLARIKLAVPTDALVEADNLVHIKNLGLPSPSRFRNLPSEWCISALRKSIEFTLRYGDELLKSYINVALAAYRKRVTLVSLTQKHDIARFLTPTVLQMGVKVWDVGSDTGIIRPPLSLKSDYETQSTEEYFDQLRANRGLFELIRVLFGAIQFCVGLLSARRISELLTLMPGETLDRTRKHLVFYNMKSGFDGMRARIARPIPPIVEHMIGMLENFQHELHKWGLLKSMKPVFAQPSRFSFEFTESTRGYIAALDLFSDYFHAPLDSSGRRHYVRPHQLRRAFAMFFFWHKSYAGLGTLTWFFGHSDPEQIYRYVTESTPGETLSWVKANYGAQLLLEDPLSAAALSDLVEEHFGTRKFSVLDFSELEQYIHQLLEDATISIEPHFFKSSDGTDYQVLAHVKGKR